ncbi:MAG: BamA/TamA family outer membrane protein [Cytophagales bacterium]|nr:BamA/TamA family outer membrane protein [Cytophagales bacterium]MDW8385037.1 BamA/TamA family outer membrane protein [Flammeovirgaceae bacterium]
MKKLCIANKWRWIIVFLTILQNGYCNAQKDTLLTIAQIMFLGNKITKEHILRRELAIQEGDRINATELDRVLEWEKNKIYNLQIFVSVEYRYEYLSLDSIRIFFDIKEQWYIFPIPHLDIGDRNFNEWLRERNADLRRLEYGMRINWRNARGRRENLRIGLQLGFTRALGFSYFFPYINRKQTISAKYEIRFAENRDVAYQTENNKLVYLRYGDKVLRERFSTSFSIGYRKRFFDNHSLRIGWQENRVDDSVIILNPEYFLDSRNIQRYTEIEYTYRYDYRDNQIYPLKGWLFFLGLNQLGVFRNEDQHVTRFYMSISKYSFLSQQFSIETTLKGRIATPSRQPFPTLQGLGYGGYLARGYDLYAIDAQHFGISQNTFRWKALDGKPRFKFIPIEQFRTIPIQVFLKGYTDIAYGYYEFVQPINKRLTNTLLIGYGVGVDIVTYYNTVVRIEYSFNRQNESKFFFYLKADI